ncbi:MAG: hypothetical protein IJ809_05135 [Clostridia bacterium]|nr:hypothetical protein [Clostridia bacterium]
MEKFLVIDGNSIMNRAFYGVPVRSMSVPGGIYTNAIYGFLNTYLMIEEMLKPDYIAVSFDLKAKTFRHEMYEDYKGQRKGMPEELKGQMPIIKEVLTAMNIPIIEMEKYEADDILGTISKINDEKGINTYILTGDRDSFQLISDKTTVVMPKTSGGKTDYLMYTPELLKENYSISPWQVVDVKALMGDSSDNIPGVKGIGEKTAYSLIEKYISLDSIYQNIDNLDATSNVIQKLKDDKEMAYISYKLATIYRDVPINIDYDLCRKKDINKEELYRIFKRLNFSKLMTRFDFTGIDENSISLSITNDDIKLNENSFALELFKIKESVTKLNQIEYIEKENVLVVYDELKKVNDVWYILNVNNKDYFVSTFDISFNFIALLIENKVYVVKLENKEFEKEFLEKFASVDICKSGYSIKQDIRYLFDIGINDIRGFNYDIMIAYYLLDSSKGKYPFDFLLSTLFSENLKVESAKKQISLFDDFDKVTSNVLDENEEYNINIYLNAIKYSKEAVLNELKNVNMDKLFSDIEMPLTETLASMEHVGMYIDVNKLNDFDIEISKRITELEKVIYTLAGLEFNINSPKQLGEVLFEKLGLPAVKKNKNGYSTDKEVLDELEDKHEIIGYILEYRQLAKLKSTYVDGMRDKITEKRQSSYYIYADCYCYRKTFIYRAKPTKYTCKT